MGEIVRAQGSVICARGSNRASKCRSTSIPVRCIESCSTLSEDDDRAPQTLCSRLNSLLSTFELIQFAPCYVSIVHAEENKAVKMYRLKRTRCIICSRRGRVDRREENQAGRPSAQEPKGVKLVLSSSSMSLFHRYLFILLCKLLLEAISFQFRFLQFRDFRKSVPQR